MKFAVYPPEDIDTLTARLWDKFLPIWREQAAMKKVEPDSSKQSDKKLIDNLNRLVKEARTLQSTSSVKSDEADHVIFQRMVPAKKGKWRLLPPEVEEPKINRHEQIRINR